MVKILQSIPKGLRKIKDELEKLAQVYVSNIDITIETISKPEEIEEEFEEFMEEETEKELAEEEDSSKVEDEEEKNKQNE